MARLGMIILAALLVCAPLASGTATEMKVNPIRKVVNLLQALQEKVTKEAKMADDLYDKFMCYCKSSGGDLQKSIDAAESKVAELQPDIEASESKKKQTDTDLEHHQEDRAKTENTMSEDTAIRQKEHGEFEEEYAEEKAEINAMDQTVHTIQEASDSASSAALLQSKGAPALRSYLRQKRTLTSEQKQLLAFLSGESGSEYEPQSGEIMGTLQSIKSEMKEDEKDMVHDEDEAEHAFEERMGSKKKEIGALKDSVGEKLDRSGRLGVDIAAMKNDLEDNTESLAEDKAFAQDMGKQCKEKAATHEAEKKMRAQEIVALADTIKILNDDDALELFKKTLPSASASFLQLQTTEVSMRNRAKKLLAQARSRIHPGHGAQHLDFISLALNGRKFGMKKVIVLIDNMIQTLKVEQEDDDNKKKYCAEELDTSEDKQKNLERSSKDLGTAMKDTKEGLATLTDEVEALKEGIVNLDKAVAEATEQRKAENAEYKDLMANNAAAKELILMAKKRLNKFYNPDSAAFVQEQSEAAPSFVQRALRRKAAPPPETMAAYTKKSGESGGVITMMDILVHDLATETAEAETDEKLAQQEYEQTMSDSAAKRSADSKSISDKEGTKAEMQNVLETSDGEQKSTDKELMAVAKYIQTLHAECDWISQYYEVRQEARKDEMDALDKTKAVLSGADYSLLQRGVTTARIHKFLPQKSL